VVVDECDWTAGHHIIIIRKAIGDGRRDLDDQSESEMMIKLEIEHPSSDLSSGLIPRSKPQTVQRMVRCGNLAGATRPDYVRSRQAADFHAIPAFDNAMPRGFLASYHTGTKS